MQQTETYKLNKPGMDDTFSVEPLNKNADILDAALADEEAARKSADSALDQRIVKLENCRVVAGWYRCTAGGAQIINLGERPVAVLVCYYGMSSTAYIGLAVGNRTFSASSGEALRLVDNGFQVGDSFSRVSSGGYYFLAFLGGWPNRDYTTTVL